MHTRVEIVAECRDDTWSATTPSRTPSPTVLTRMRATGALAARLTGAHQVHLIGTAAGPLGGDTVEIDVTVHPGARLTLRGVAATLALPSRPVAPAHVTLRLHVAAHARLDVALEPVVVAAGADLHATTHVDVASGGTLDLTEQVLLGRVGEAAGRWTGTLRADHAGRPWVRQQLALGPGSPAWDALAAPRALVSRLRSPDAPGSSGPATAVSVGDAVLAPLARGGCLLDAYGDDLTRAWADAELTEVLHAAHRDQAHHDPGGAAQSVRATNRQNG